MDVKIRSNDEIDAYSESDLEKEKQHLLEKVSPNEIIDYIKNSIEILLNMKDDDYEEIKQELKKQKQESKALKNKLK